MIFPKYNLFKKIIIIMKKFSNIKKVSSKLEDDDKKYKENIIFEVADYNTTNSSMNKDIVKLFSKIFETKEVAHVYHLKASGGDSSYSQHISLETYYNDILDKLDEIIEIYQGKYGLIEGYEIIDTSTTKDKDPIDYFLESVEFIVDYRSCIDVNDTWLYSKLDDIIGMLYQLIYRLKFTR